MSDRVFVIDEGACTGCHACEIACKDRAGLPDDLDFVRVEEHVSGTVPEIDLFFRVTHCYHCSEPPCVEVCPTGAMHVVNGGLVSVDREACIGCEACAGACPFDAIVMLPGGIAAKCDGCPDEVEAGWGPTCVRACPMRALDYGPVPLSLPDRRIADGEFKDRGIGPSVLYLRRSLEAK